MSVATGTTVGADAGERPDALKLAKHNALTLATAQALVGAVAPVCISLGGQAGDHLLGDDKSLATAPVAGYNIGLALGALPAALLMRMIGRRYGLMAGALITSAGGGVAAFALFTGQFWLFAVGLLIAGFASSFAQQYRFAAVDHAPEEFKPRAISWVLAGGVFAAVIGPQMAMHTEDLFDGALFAGSFLGVIVLGIAGMAAIAFLRSPPPVLGDRVVAEGPSARPLGAIVTQPQFIAALTCSVGAFGLMSFVMTGAPLAMVHEGHHRDMATLGIQWHVMAMFGPSFFTGTLIARFGRDSVMLVGFTLLVGCAVVAIAGMSLANFWIALVLLGVGWNFAFIGATSMVTEAYHPSERNKAQGFHDLVLFSCVAFASLMAGQTLNAYGWAMLNWVVFPVSLVCIVALFGARRSRAVAT